jgi:uncharacterized protein
VRIGGIVWLPGVVDKLANKHSVDTMEVEEVLSNQPHFRRIARGNVAGENLYAMMGQSNAGRYLMTFFVYKQSYDALIISARDMTIAERRRYEKA